MAAIQAKRSCNGCMLLTMELWKHYIEKIMSDMVLPFDAYRDRFEDYRRHLVDLRDHTYEGFVDRPGREATFMRAVELLSPVVCDVLHEFGRVMLDNTGTVEWRPVQSDGDGGLISMWLLSWPLQRTARRRLTGMWDRNSEPTQPTVLRTCFENHVS